MDPEDVVEILVVESKNDSDGQNQYKIKYTKYFWLKEDNLQGYEKLVEDFLAQKNSVPDESPSPVFTPKKKKKKKKRIQPLSGDEGSDDMAPLFLSDFEEQEDDQDDADFVPSQSSVNRSTNNNERKERTPRNASRHASMANSLAFFAPSYNFISSKKQKRKNSAPIKLKISVADASGETRIQESRYNCSYCTRSYLRRSECRKHERTHTGENPYYCKLCNVHLLKPSKLKAHILTKNHARRAAISAASTGFHLCIMCSAEFTDLTTLREHEQSSHALYQKSNAIPIIAIPEPPDGIGATPSTQSSVGNDSTDHISEQTTSNNNNTSTEGDVKNPEAGTGDSSSQPDEGSKEAEGSNPATNCRIVTDPLTGKQRYQCQKCEKSFVSRKIFKMHLRIHNGSNPYYCPVCKQYFLKRVELRNHLKTKKHLDRVAENVAAGIPVVEINPDEISPPTSKMDIVCQGPEITYPCPHCPKKFLSKRSMNLHEKVHLGTSRHFCQICNKQFYRKIHLQYHKWSVHTENLPFKCDVCSARFRVPCDLKKHSMIHPSCRVCNTCKKEFDSASLLTEHLKESSGCIGYKCGICECIFMDQKGYDKHIVRHNEQHMVEIPPTETEKITKYLCKHCKKEFASKKACREHLSVHLGTSRHFCDLCNQYFAKQTQLVAHQATAHSHERPYQCDVCNASFKLMSNLKIHKSTHIANRKCKTCAKDFDSVILLKEHLKESNECLSYKCDTCNLIFIEKKRHTEHMKVKHGIGDKRVKTNQHGNAQKFPTPRNHVCQLCGEAYTLSTALRQHMEWHKTGRYPNQCPDCERPFFSKWKLDRHITTVHMGLRQYECEICTKDFKSKTALKLHVMKDHEQTTIKCDTCSKEFMTNHGYEQHKAQYCKATNKRKKSSTTVTSEQISASLAFSAITGDLASAAAGPVATTSKDPDDEISARGVGPIDMMIDRSSVTAGGYMSSNVPASSSVGNSSKVYVSSPFLVENIVPRHGAEADPDDGSHRKTTVSVPSISSFFQPSYGHVPYAANMVGEPVNLPVSSINLPTSNIVIANSMASKGKQLPSSIDLGNGPVSMETQGGSVLSIESSGKPLLTSSSSYPYRQIQGNELVAQQTYVAMKDSRLNTPLLTPSSTSSAPVGASSSAASDQVLIQPRGQVVVQNTDYVPSQQRPGQGTSNGDRFTFAQALMQNQYQY